MTILFWVLATLIAFSLVGYPLLMWMLATLRPSRPVPSSAPPGLEAVLLIPAHNEERDIGVKLENALSLPTGGARLGIVVACDGCTDATAAIARRYGDRGVRVVESVGRLGKIGTMNLALKEIAGDVLILSDANSQIVPEALPAMLRHFGDPGVGGVCGAVRVPRRGRNWLGQGESAYWSFDHKLKLWESQVSGAVSAQGTLYAVRRSLVSPLPDFVADDLVMSLRVVAQGYRLVFEPLASAFEAVSDSTGKEFRRRVRSTERGWRGLMMMRQLLDPRRHGFYAVQLFSHKVLRRLTPFLLLAFALASLLTASQGGVYRATAMVLVVGLLVGVGGWLGRRWLPRAAQVPAFLAMSQVAMALGVLNVVRGKRSSFWTPAREGSPAGGPSPLGG